MRSRSEPTPSIPADDAAKLIQDKFGTEYAAPSDMDYFRFPRTYGSTAGPFGGIGGCAMTQFTLEVWQDSTSNFGVVFCKGKVLAVTDTVQVDGQWR